MSQTFRHFNPSSLHSRIFRHSGFPVLGLSPIAIVFNVRDLIVCGFRNSTLIVDSLLLTCAPSAFIDLSEYGSLTARTYRSLP